MSPAVIKIKPDQLEQLEHLILKNPHATTVNKKGEYESFRINFAGESIIAYTSGKIVSNGPRAEAIVQTAVLSLDSLEIDIDIIIGSDEAGKGEWLGPLVIAAVALTPSQSKILQSLGVMDSKDLPIDKMAGLTHDIEMNCTDKNILLITPETFNKRFQELHAEGKDLNDFLAWAHSKAIADVYQNISSDKQIRVVIDEFARIKTEQRLARLIPLESIELIQRHHAEDEIAVAAASILAREAREEWIDRQSKKMDLDLREMSVIDAKSHPDCQLFSKLHYLNTMVKR